jgi:hypothetical protein
MMNADSIRFDIVRARGADSPIQFDPKNVVCSPLLQTSPEGYRDEGGPDTGGSRRPKQGSFVDDSFRRGA